MTRHRWRGLSVRRAAAVRLVLVLMLLAPAAALAGLRPAAMPRTVPVIAGTSPPAGSSLTAPYNIFDFKQAGSLTVDPFTGYL